MGNIGILFVVGALLVIAGVFLILKAIWLLRLGHDERRFILYGLFGVILIMSPWLLIALFGMTAGVSVMNGSVNGGINGGITNF